MALTIPRSKPVYIFPFYVKGKKTAKQNKPNKHKPPQGTLRGFVGIIWM